jgi:sugar lactone lactonase YvrE
VRRVVAAAVVAAAAGVAVIAAGAWWASHPPIEPIAPSWPSWVHVLAGNGSTGLRDGERLRAQFIDPYDVAIGPDGLVYVADGNRIRVIGSDGRVATFAGAGDAGFRDGQPQAARFDALSGVAFDREGTLYVADTGNNAIRRISPAGEVSTITAASEWGDTPEDTRFNGPVGIAVDAAGQIFIADTYNDRIRRISSGGVATTVAGTARGYADGAAGDARFDTPTGLAIDGNGTVYVADTGNYRIRAVAPDGRVSTLIDPSQDLGRPLSVAIAPSGELYITTEDGRILERAQNGALRVVAGTIDGFRDGPGDEARFRRPSGVAWQSAGQLIVADAGNLMVRSVAARPRLTPRSPLWSGEPRFELETFAMQPLLWPLAPLHGPFEVAGTMGEARGVEAGRFHAGIDVRAEQGSAVLAVRDGFVREPLAVSGFGSLNESIRVGPLSYVHLRAGRDRQGRVTDARFVPTFDDSGRLSDIRAKRGARFAVGDIVGTVNPFNHVHLTVGWPGEEYNPLLLRLPQFRDAIPPVIAAGGIQLFSTDGKRLTVRSKRRLLVSGDVSIVVDAWDQADGNRPNRRLGLFELGYQVLHADGTPAPGFASPRMTIRFDHLGDAAAPALVYAAGSGIPFYGERRTRFLYVVTNTFRGGQAAAGLWQAGQLPPGDYTLRIHARDASGNVAAKNRDLAITIVAG